MNQVTSTEGPPGPSRTGSILGRISSGLSWGRPKNANSRVLPVWNPESVGPSASADSIGGASAASASSSVPNDHDTDVTDRQDSKTSSTYCEVFSDLKISRG